jgi:hypothetical protein
MTITIWGACLLAVETQSPETIARTIGGHEQKTRTRR